MLRPLISRKNMRHRFHASIAACLASASALLTASNTRAGDPTTADCLSANEHSIQLRADHKLRDARAQLLICAASSCPGDVRNACTRRVMDVNTAIPTIVFEAKDAAGNDLTVVKVSMDGHPLLQKLEGIAISLDPGEHKFSFETPGQPSVEKTIVLQEAEKGRHVTVTFGAQPSPTPPPEATAAPAPSAPTTPPPTASPSSPSSPLSAATPEPSLESAVHMSFVPPDDRSPWSLHAPGGELLCRLPCTRWVGPVSNYYVQKDEVRLATERLTEPLRIRVPDNLSYPAGSAVAARVSLAQGSLVWPIVTGVASLGPLAIGIVFLVSNHSCTPNDQQCNQTNQLNTNTVGPVFSAVGLVGLAASVGWFVWSHGNRLDVSPPQGEVSAFRFTLRPTPTGVAGTF
jgi:hypothetical protein